MAVVSRLSKEKIGCWAMQTAPWKMHNDARSFFNIEQCFGTAKEYSNIFIKNKISYISFDGKHYLQAKEAVAMSCHRNEVSSIHHGRSCAFSTDNAIHLRTFWTIFSAMQNATGIKSESIICSHSSWAMFCMFNCRYTKRRFRKEPNKPIVTLSAEKLGFHFRRYNELEIATDRTFCWEIWKESSTYRPICNWKECQATCPLLSSSLFTSIGKPDYISLAYQGFVAWCPFTHKNGLPRKR